MVQDVNPAANPIELGGDAIVIVAWEKGAELYYWTGDGFSWITISG